MNSELRESSLRAQTKLHFLQTLLKWTAIFAWPGFGCTETELFLQGLVSCLTLVRYKYKVLRGQTTALVGMCRECNLQSTSLRDAHLCASTAPSLSAPKALGTAWGRGWDDLTVGLLGSGVGMGRRGEKAKKNKVMQQRVESCRVFLFLVLRLLPVFSPTHVWFSFFSSSLRTEKLAQGSLNYLLLSDLTSMQLKQKLGSRAVFLQPLLDWNLKGMG